MSKRKLPPHIGQFVEESYEQIRALDPEQFDRLLQEHIEFIRAELPEHTRNGCPSDFLLSALYHKNRKHLMGPKCPQSVEALLDAAAMQVALQRVYSDQN